MRAINFLGAGNMARALASGLARAGVGAEICAADPSAAARDLLLGEAPRATVRTNAQNLPPADAVVLAVKPFHLAQALENWDPAGALVISVVAGARIGSISRLLGGHRRIVRAMPNTPALHGAGMTGLYAPREADGSDKSAAETVFAAVGRTLWVPDESLLDAVTAVSGSGPAYFFRFFEALLQAAAATGLDEGSARLLVAETMRGALHMLEGSGKTPTELREGVTSKNGTTHAAMRAMDAGHFEQTVVEAVRAAKERGEEISREIESP